jgi:hypothetical protein
MELKDIVNYGPFGVLPRMAVKEHARQKSKDEEERQAQEQAAAEQAAAQGGMKKGGKVSSASKRADGCATKGKTRGKMV